MTFFLCFVMILNFFACGFFRLCVSDAGRGFPVGLELLSHTCNNRWLNLLCLLYKLLLTCVLLFH